MPLRLGLYRIDEADKDLALAGETFFDRKLDRSAHRVDSRVRCFEAARLFRDAFLDLVEDSVVRFDGPFGGPAERFVSRDDGSCVVLGRVDDVDVISDDLIHIAELLGFRCGHELPGDDDVERGRDANEPRQTLRAARARDDAERDFGEANACVGRGHASVTAERKLEPAAGGDTLDGGDDRFRRSFERVDDIRKMRRVGRGLFAELPDVGSSAKELSFPRENDGLDAFIFESFRELFRERRPHGGPEAVHRRVVDRKDANRAVLSHFDDAAHETSI